MKKNESPQKYIGIAILMLALLAFFAIPSYYTLRLVYRATGMPGPLVSQILTLLLTCVLFFALFKLFGLYIHRHPEKQRHRHFPKVMMDTMDALDRITTGDFDIAIESSEDDRYYHDLADRINKMAEGLRSMEHLRQDFISNVSHEIQSPLTSIAGFATLLRQENLPEQQRLHYIGIIEAEAGRLSKLSDNLLRLSMLDTEDLEIDCAPFRLDSQLEDILLLLEPQWAQKNLNLDVQLEKLEINADADLLNQVWMNLLHNAIKFTPEGGSIHVTLSRRDGVTRCSISDSGIGIPEENLMYIFERFYKVDKSRDRSLGGNGLGLSLARRIVQLHGGSIDVQSEEGHGTTFNVSIP